MSRLDVKHAHQIQATVNERIHMRTQTPVTVRVIKDLQAGTRQALPSSMSHKDRQRIPRFDNREPTPAANDPHGQHRLTVRAGVQIDVWRNLPGEVNAGACARLVVQQVPGIGAWGCADTRDALEKLALDLEMIAADVRRLARSR